MIKKVKQLREIVSQQIEFGASEHAMHRMANLLDDILENEQFQEEGQRLIPGTRQFNQYVFQKANCKADIKRIAYRFGIGEDEVLQAYEDGRPQGVL